MVPGALHMKSSLRRAALQLHETFTGRKILERLDELNRTQWLSYDELLALQSKKLQRLVEYAYQYVPYYQKVFDTVGFHPEDLRQNPDYFSKLPVLTKSIIRENWDELLTTEPERRQQLSKLSTSGSTGNPLIFMQDPDFRDVVTADIQRHIGWAGCGLGDRHAFIWGASQHMRFRQKMRIRLIDRVWNRFQIDAFTMTEETMANFARRVCRDKPKVLFGYATALYRFAQFIRTSPFKGISFRGIFTTSETLLPHVRQYLEETFQCKVYNRYGTLELGGVACECEAHTGLHISMENNFVEILSDGLPVKTGEVGEIIVTNLNNLGMPFIRYNIGDAGAWYTGEDCPCGRKLPMLKTLEGRLVEAFYTRDGRSVWSGFAGAAYRCLAHPTIQQFQIVQKSLEKMIVRLVPKGTIPRPILDEISQAIRTSYGENVVVDFEFPDEIPLLPSGKHSYAISELNRK